MAKWEVNDDPGKPADVTGDLIRRADAIERLDDLAQAFDCGGLYDRRNGLRDAIVTIRDLPAAQVGVKPLDWVNVPTGYGAAEAREKALLENNESERKTLIRHNAAHAARVSKLTAKLEAVREALRPFADIGIGSDPDYQPTIRMDRAAIVAARVAVEMDGASMPDKINWRYDPAAIVEDDEPMIGRDYE